MLYEKPQRLPQEEELGCRNASAKAGGVLVFGFANYRDPGGCGKGLREGLGEC